MKVPSHLLTAMLLTAAISTTATSCANLKIKLNKGNTEQGGENQNRGGESCPACGMG